MLTCPSGTIPVAPGFEPSAGDADPGRLGVRPDSARATGRSPSTRPSHDRRSRLSVHCLSYHDAPVDGHTHDLSSPTSSRRSPSRVHTAKRGRRVPDQLPRRRQGHRRHLAPAGRVSSTSATTRGSRPVRSGSSTTPGWPRRRPSTCSACTTGPPARSWAPPGPVTIVNTATVTLDVGRRGDTNNSAVRRRSRSSRAPSPRRPRERPPVRLVARPCDVASSMPGTGSVKVKSGGTAARARAPMTLKPGKVSTAHGQAHQGRQAQDRPGCTR